MTYSWIIKSCKKQQTYYPSHQQLVTHLQATGQLKILDAILAPSFDKF